MLKITNTLSGKREEFHVPDRKVRLYVCGVTPYDHAHLGHGRCYVSFDVLLRVLAFLGYDVTYCRNFTDIDDKLINRAAKETGDELRYKEIADRYIASYKEDMHALNCIAPAYEPRVTDNIPQIIAFIEDLIASGHAYAVDGDVYFNIPTFPQYAALSKHDVHDLRAGARVELNDRKKDPLDFALWKGEAEGTFWKSPWGYGRPGWHIECSALARTYLGDQIDIHCGGMDLIFPHHENEIAQSEAVTKKTFSRYWMHNAHVFVNKEKMSKSLGNFFTLKDIFAQYDPMVVRFYFLNHQYRAPLDFSFESLAQVQKTYQRLVRAFEQVNQALATKHAAQQSPIVTRMLEFVLDDLNTVGALGVLFEELPALAQNEQEKAAVYWFLREVFGLTLVPLAQPVVEMTPQIKALLDARDAARAAKDWKRADELRDELRSLGFEIQDKKLK